MDINETVVKLANGKSLCSSSEEFMAGDYVRLVAENGDELFYWDNQEWAESPIEVMGAILRAAAE